VEKIKLSSEEKAELKRLHRTLKDRKSSDRIKAILMLDDGYSGQEIATILLLDENTITAWKTGYLARKNTTNWLFHSCKGYAGKLSECELKAVAQYVEENLISDSKQVQHFILETFEKLYSVNGVIELLNRLGFRYKQTTLVPAKHNPELQKEFKTAYDEFSQNLKEDEALFFLDAVHPQHNTSCTHAWIKVGQQKQIKSNSGRKRLNIIGAYNPFTQDIVFDEHDTINSESVIGFFHKIEISHPNKSSIFVVADQAPYFKHKAVKKYLETSRIELISLPTYSPNLNLIERLWKLMRKKIINSPYYEKFKDFKAAIFGFLKNNSPAFKQELQRFIGFKLHLLPSP
jgi:transposase